MLELLEQLYLHRISHLNKYAIRQNTLQNNQDLIIPTKQEISAYMSGQLSLFPKGSGMTLIQWQRDKVAFLELFTAVYELPGSGFMELYTMKQYFYIVFWKKPLSKFPDFKTVQIKFPFNRIRFIKRIVHHFIYKPFTGQVEGVKVFVIGYS